MILRYSTKTYFPRKGVGGTDINMDSIKGLFIGKAERKMNKTKKTCTWTNTTTADGGGWF